MIVWTRLRPQRFMAELLARLRLTKSGRYDRMSFVYRWKRPIGVHHTPG